MPNPQPRNYRWIVARVFLLACVFAAGPAQGQLSISGPLDDLGHDSAESPMGSVDSNPWPIALASASQPYSTAPRPVETQIHIKVHYLVLTGEQRRMLYEQLGDQPHLTQTSTTPKPPVTDLSKFAGQIESHSAVRSVQRCSRVVFASSLLPDLFDQVQVDEHSRVERSPAVILIEGNQAEMNNLTERPFAIGVDESQQQQVEFLVEGTQLRIFAHRQPTSVGQSESSPLRVVAELQFSRLDSSDTENVLIDKDTFVEIAAPKQTTKSVVVSSVVDSGQSILIDPLVNLPIRIQREKAMPVIGRVPLLGKAFTSLEETSVDQHTMVVLTPKVVIQP
ncbi:hypothetical protein [Rubripirellula amarantea]|nr:hypothetical protein [Rubripirellula amarantea]